MQNFCIDLMLLFPLPPAPSPPSLLPLPLFSLTTNLPTAAPMRYVLWLGGSYCQKQTCKTSANTYVHVQCRWIKLKLLHTCVHTCTNKYAHDYYINQLIKFKLLGNSARTHTHTHTHTHSQPARMLCHNCIQAQLNRRMHNTSIGAAQQPWRKPVICSSTCMYVRARGIHVVYIKYMRFCLGYWIYKQDETVQLIVTRIRDIPELCIIIIVHINY